MRILAVCDDVMIDRKRMADEAMRYFISIHKEKEWSVQSYSSETELLSQINKKDAADIFLLDIELSQTNGIELAKKIHSVHPAAIIIYVSGHLDYSLDGYEDGFRFIDKKALATELPRALAAALRKIESEDQPCVVLPLHKGSKNEGLIRVNISDILYVKREGYKTIICTANQGIIEESFFSVREFNAKLNSSRFIFVDKGTIINISYFDKIEKNVIKRHQKEHKGYSVILKLPDGKSIKFGISRRGRALLLDEITKRWSSNFDDLTVGVEQ